MSTVNVYVIYTLIETILGLIEVAWEVKKSLFLTSIYTFCFILSIYR